MTVQCVNCKHWRLKGSPLAQNGAGLCQRTGETATYYGAHFARDCGRFSPADQTVAASREAWLAKAGKKTEERVDAAA